MIDQALVTQIQNGDKDAFAILVKQYDRMVYNTVLAMVQQVQDAEDIAQEVFIKIFQAICSFKGEAQLSTWIYRICIHKSLDYLKHKKRIKRFAFLQPLFSTNAQEVFVEESFHHPGVLLANKERAALLFKAINLLPHNQKTAIILQKIEGLNQQEIAEAMGLKIGAVESQLTRAKQNLRKWLTHYYHNQ